MTIIVTSFPVLYDQLVIKLCYMTDWLYSFPQLLYDQLVMVSSPSSSFLWISISRLHVAQMLYATNFATWFNNSNLKRAPNLHPSNFILRKDFISNPAALRRRCHAAALLLLLLSPFLLSLSLTLFLLLHAEAYYRQPSLVGTRGWSNLARWLFRGYNEVRMKY